MEINLILISFLWSSTTIIKTTNRIKKLVTSIAVELSGEDLAAVKTKYVINTEPIKHTKPKKFSDGLISIPSTKSDVIKMNAGKIYSAIKLFFNAKSKKAVEKASPYV
jgi:hypothetical protein